MGPNLIALAIPVFFLGIGIEAAIGKFKGRAVHRLGDSMADMGCGILQQLVSTLLAAKILLTAYEALYAHRVLTYDGGFTPWVIGIIAVEFAYYWWHRLSHEVNFLWAAHVVHHQSEDYNLSVALRQSVATWATTLPFYLPIAFLGVTPFQFSVILSLSTLYQFWIHTELVPSLGVVEYVFNTPALHRVHHAINVQYLDKNHAATFSIFDVLFGTFQREAEPCVYGTTRPLNSFNPVYAQFDYPRELLKAMRAAPSLWQAVQVLFRSPAWKPAWWPADPRVRAGSERFDLPVEPRTRRYCFWQFAVMLVAVFLFLMFGGALSPLSQLLCTSWIVLSVINLPAIYEHKSWARGLEMFRAVSAVVVVAVVFYVQ